MTTSRIVRRTLLPINWRAMLNIWKIGLGAGYETWNDLEQYNVFVRFNFR